MANREYTVEINNNKQKEIKLQLAVLAEFGGEGSRVEYNSVIQDNIYRAVGYISQAGSSFDNVKPGIISVCNCKEDDVIENITLNINGQNRTLGDYIYQEQKYGSNPEIFISCNNCISVKDYIRLSNNDSVKVTVDGVEYNASVQLVDTIDITGAEVVETAPLGFVYIDDVKINYSGGNYGTYSYIDKDNNTQSGTIDGAGTLSEVLFDCQKNGYELNISITGSKLTICEPENNLIVMSTLYKKTLDNGDEVQVALEPGIKLSNNTWHDAASGVNLLTGTNYFYIGCINDFRGVTINKDGEALSNMIYCKVNYTIGT